MLVAFQALMRVSFFVLALGPLRSKSLATCAAYCKSSRVVVLAIVLSLDRKRGLTTVDRQLIGFDLSSR
jgi:hypothetical protein